MTIFLCNSAKIKVEKKFIHQQKKQKKIYILTLDKQKRVSSIKVIR